MKICKVRPNCSTCSACIATQEMFNVVDDCSRCKSNTDTYELLQVGTGFWSGDYAMVQKDGKITKVSLNRVYDDYGRITESVRNFGRGVEQSFGADGETG